MKIEKESKFVLDTFALIAFFNKEHGGNKIEKILIESEKGRCQVYFNEVNLGEVYYRIWKDQQEEVAKQALNVCLNLPIKFVPVDRDFILSAAELKAKYKISYADAFCLETAKRNKCPVVTGDPEFLKVRGIKTIWLSK